MSAARAGIALATALALSGAAGCGGSGSTDRAGGPRRPPERPVPVRPQRGSPPRVKPARCPADAANCRSASGRIVYVEAVDPDGDGDAHFVLISAQSITSPGISVIDVRRGLRPHPLPRIGAEISAAGPVHTGSYGQRQIEATVLHTANR